MPTQSLQKMTLQNRGEHMEIISFVNQKGGTAKTTSCLNIGAALALAGRSVLLVDLDPQGSLTKCAGYRDLSDLPTAYEVIKGDVDINDAIIKTSGNYDLLPNDIRMSSAEIELISAPGRDYLLKEALEDLNKAYDYILIDCSPSLNILTLMALTACNGYIVPMAAQFMPLDGLAQLQKTTEIVKKRLNKSLELYGVLVTQYDSRRSLDKEILKAIQARFPEETFNTVVRNNSKLAEAPTFGKDIFQYEPRSAGASAYKEIAEEIINRLEKESKDNA